MRGVRRVTFAPTPREEALAEMAGALLQAALLLMFWPLIVPLRLLRMGERLVAEGAGVWLGLMQGGAYAAAALAHLLLSRGGMRQLLWGTGARVHRAVSVPVPVTPPKADAPPDRMSSEILSAAIAAAVAAAAAAQPAAEPAVPQPLTPPVVAHASGPTSPTQPPSVASAGSGEPAAPATAPAAAAPGGSGIGPSVVGPLLPRAEAPAAPLPVEAAPVGPAGAAGGGVVDDGSQGLLLPAQPPAVPSAAEQPAEGTEGEPKSKHYPEEAGEEAFLLEATPLVEQDFQGLGQLLATQDSGQLLAAFEPAGPAAAQAAAAWLEASEPVGRRYGTPSADKRQPLAREGGPAAWPRHPFGADSTAATAGSSTAVLASPLPPTPAIAAPAVVDTRGLDLLPRPGAEVDLPGNGTDAGVDAGPGPGLFGAAARSADSLGGSSGGGFSGEAEAEPDASRPLLDTLAGLEGTGGKSLEGLDPTAEAAPVQGLSADHRTGGLQVALAGAAAEAVHGIAAELAPPVGGGEVAPHIGAAELALELEVAELARDDSIEITRHTKREKR